MEYLTNAYWDVGSRNANEDSLALEIVDTPGGQLLMAAVADGVGGMEEGAVASGFVLETITGRFLGEVVPSVVKGFSVSKIKRIIERGLYFAANELARYGGIKSLNLGTTLAILILYKHRYVVVSVGDSAVFCCRKNKIKKLTQSHVNADGTLGKCVSSHGYQSSSVKWGLTARNRGFLVCSDGFYKRMPPDCEMFNPRMITTEEMIGSRFRQMSEYLRKCGEGDNMSAVYIKCVNE